MAWLLVVVLWLFVQNEFTLRKLSEHHVAQKKNSMSLSELILREEMSVTKRGTPGISLLREAKQVLEA